jgi:hypothetical protein
VEDDDEDACAECKVDDRKEKREPVESTSVMFGSIKNDNDN